MYDDPGPEELQEEIGPLPENVAVLMTAAAAGFFLIYATTVLIDVLPAQPLDPIWVQRMVSAVLNNVGFPLIGLILMHLAWLLFPGDHIVGRWTMRVQVLATIAALLMLALIPIHGLATMRAFQYQKLELAKQLEQADQRFNTLRRIVVEASTAEELQQGFSSNNGPQLMRSDLERPLPVLREDLLQGLGEARKQAGQELAGPTGSAIWAGIVRSVQKGSIALAMAIAFAAGARLPGREEPLLALWIAAVFQGRRRLGQRRSDVPPGWMDDRRD